MIENALVSTTKKEDYLLVNKLRTEPDKLTDQDIEDLLVIYKNFAPVRGLTDEYLQKLCLVFDSAGGYDKEAVMKSPLIGLLDEPDKELLAHLIVMICDGYTDSSLAVTGKDIALSEDGTESLRLAVARVALDCMTIRKDISEHRADIQALTVFLSSAEDAAFEQASIFIREVQIQCLGRNKDANGKGGAR